MLRGLGIGATVIDHDPAQIDTVRRFGWKAYYGDATRMDLLESAGAQARAPAVRRDRRCRGAMRLVKRARRYFPDLQLVVRAHSRTDAYEYAEMGVPPCARCSARPRMPPARARALGYSHRNGANILRRFREYDEEQIVRNAPHRHDLKKLIALTEQGGATSPSCSRPTRSAPQVDQNDAGGDGERRGSGEAPLSGSTEHHAAAMPNMGVRNESTLRARAAR